jgi:hypothetical protein
MLKRIESHLTPSTVIAFIALLFAMTGGALATTNSGGSSRGSGTRSTASTTLATAAKSKAKVKTKTGPRGPAGKNGPAGPVGPAGPAGPAGSQGPAGATGATGAKGETGATGAPGGEGKAGKEGKTGKEGSPWTAGGTLPSGSSEHGAWIVSGPGSGPFASASTAISFIIPLATALTEPKLHYIKPGATPPPGCSGTAESPEAESGNLCVFAGFEEGVETPTLALSADPKSGVLILLSPVATSAFGQGSWVVTG